MESRVSIYSVVSTGFLFIDIKLSKIFQILHNELTTDLKEHAAFYKIKINTFFMALKGKKDHFCAAIYLYMSLT